MFLYFSLYILYIFLIYFYTFPLLYILFTLLYIHFIYFVNNLCIFEIFEGVAGKIKCANYTFTHYVAYDTFHMFLIICIFYVFAFHFLTYYLIKYSKTEGRRHVKYTTFS